MKKSNSSLLSSFISMVIAIVVLIAVLVPIRLSFKNKLKQSEIDWNNGVCSRCLSGHLSFHSSTPRVGLEEAKYFYVCDNCLSTFVLYKVMD